MGGKAGSEKAIVDPRHTLTVIMSRTISSTSETTLKTSGRVARPVALAVSTAANVGVVRAGQISSSIAPMRRPRHHPITIRGQLLFPI